MFLKTTSTKALRTTFLTKETTCKDWSCQGSNLWPTNLHTPSLPIRLCHLPIFWTTHRYNAVILVTQYLNNVRHHYTNPVLNNKQNLWPSFWPRSNLKINHYLKINQWISTKQFSSLYKIMVLTIRLIYYLYIF